MSLPKKWTETGPKARNNVLPVRVKTVTDRAEILKTVITQLAEIKIVSAAGLTQAVFRQINCLKSV